MKVLDREQIIRMEEMAVTGGVSLSVLMEQAGAAVAEEASIMVADGANVVILCGKGNNGGDGFVCARLLAKRGIHITVILALGKPTTEIATAAYEHMGGEVLVLKSDDMENCRMVLSSADLIIDAIFGFSFRGKLRENQAQLIELANEACAKKLAVDLPSGVECDSASVRGTAFCADRTVTFHVLKPANISYPGKEYCGETKVCDLGISHLLPDKAQTIATDSQFVRQYLPGRRITGNKGDFGKLLLLCGSYGMAGACVLAARAALRSGVGLLYILMDQRIYPIVSTAVPEAVCIPVDLENQNELHTQIEKSLKTCTACVMGCGLGDARATICEAALSSCNIPLLIDADGINYLADHPQLQSYLTNRTVLTPHPGELSRLIGREIPDIQGNRLETALETAKKLNCILLLKGAGTVIAEPGGQMAVNTTGNPGMAKGGSGDALSGMIGALLAQGVEPFAAAVAGAYLHGAAGDLCGQRMSMRAMLPSDLIAALPELYKGYELKNNKRD